MHDVAVALTTAPSNEVAERLACTLVDEGLAACVNLVPGVVSIYRWEGQRERAQEILCVIKTRLGAVDRLRARLVELHPYQVPELVVLEVTDGLPAYLGWVRDQVP
jgi:periplasmic divalent cation tolerance protein